MEDMGMTDKQFNGFLRLLIKDLKEIQKLIETENKKTSEEKIQEIIDNLQQTMEN